MRQFRAALCVAMLVTMAAAPRAEAQAIGSFSWQTQPFCNVLTVTVVQQAAGYQLVGFDDQCGGAPAPVTGTAIAGGSGVAFGVAVALPTGRTAHLSATISLATLSGTWLDADGNTGAFAFAASTGGAPRPAPAAATQITAAQLAPAIFAGSGTAATVARSDHTHDDRYFTEPETTTLLAGKANRGEVLGFGFAANSAFSYTPETTLVSRGITTTVAGRLHIKYSFGANITCTPTADAGRLVYLQVDGQSIPNSAVQRFSATGAGAWLFSGSVEGVTTDVLPAGNHTVSVGAECSTAETASWTSLGNFYGLVVTVVP